MSRLPATSAANLANDLEHALTVCEQQLADTVQQLEEANAVIDAVRQVRSSLDLVAKDTHSFWVRDGSQIDFGLATAYRRSVSALDEVPGL